jgi:hypothetical protein
VQPEPICVDISARVTDAFVSQLSAAVGDAAVGTEPQVTVTLAGTPDKTGAVVSRTVMICAAVLLLPQTSVAVHIRVME